MKNKITLMFLSIFFIGLAGAKAQDLANYNLYVQNGYLYNPALTIGDKGLNAFINSHNQWIGFDGAPRVNTFGINAAVNKTSGLGLTVISSQSGVIQNFNMKLNYAYKAKISDNHYLRMGAGLGFMNDNLNDFNSYTDLTDDILIDGSYKMMSVLASAGVAYNFNGFEAQFMMPQIYKRNELNPYAITTLSYRHEFNNTWGVKPAFLMRGFESTPGQFDASIVADYQKMLWVQGGYRTNNSLLAGLGVNLYNIGIGYIYQYNNGTLAATSSGTHEVQISYHFGDNLFDGPKKVPVAGFVKSIRDNAPIAAQIKVINQDGKKVQEFTANSEDGFYRTNLRPGQYTFEISATDFYNSKEVLVITKEDDPKTGKTEDYKLIPENAKVSGFVLRDDNNSPLKAVIEVFNQEGAKIQTVETTVVNGKYELTLKSGQNYEFAVSAENCESVKQAVSIPAKEYQKTVNINLIHDAIVRGSVKDKKDKTELTYYLNVYKNGTLQNSLNQNGDFEIMLKKGEKYTLEFKASDYLSQRVTLDFTGANTKTETRTDILLEKMSKESFSLGNIEFKTGTSELTNASYTILDKLVKLMKDNPELRVEIGGHTDDVGSATTNQKISEDRANSCVDYLIKKGIDTKRIEAKGYGESKPLVPNTSDENRAKNRRVEFKFID